MKHKSLLGAILVLALLLAACAPAATEVPTLTSAPTLEPTEPLATDTAVATASPAVVNTQAAETPTAGIPVTGATTVRASLSDSHGPILVDGDGVALYVFTNDVQNGDSSACTDAECSAAWLPVIAEGGDPVAGAGAIQKLLGTITRDDGTVQVTYNGWPLYYSADDHGAGSTNGQGVDNAWFLLAPSGKAIQE